jgi:hypothetical protein
VFGLRPLGLSRLHRLDGFVVVVADHLRFGNPARIWYNGGMEAATRRTTKRRIQVSLSDDLYDRLAVQAAVGQGSIQDLITRWLEEKLAETEPQEADSKVNGEWRRRFEDLVAEFRSGVPADASPEEIEADIAAARAEVREARRASRH